MSIATFTGVGCMSGSSLDGLDLCCVEFSGDVSCNVWSYRIIKGQTLPYSDEWSERLANAANVSGKELVRLHVDYGRFIGESVSEFIEEHDLRCVQFVASHGHSVFHQPDDKFTFQLGDGETTAIHLDTLFVCNFRSRDVALSGQGAPLVPCGEKFLFSQYDICVNLGGIANIGVKGMHGYDVCPCNTVLNSLAMQHAHQIAFDKDGDIAKSGTAVEALLDKLEKLSFYKIPPPKSLWREWIQNEVFPLLDPNCHSIEELLRTMTEHVARRVSVACLIAQKSLGKAGDAADATNILLTGGGAFNKFLVSRIEANLQGRNFEFETADDDTINFKEALIFAFLGLRCLLGQENILRDITGASEDTISGSIHRPKKYKTENPKSFI